MNLIFDLGNTMQKMAIMSSGKVIEIVKKPKITTKDIAKIIGKHSPTQAILSSVVDETEEITNFFKKRIPLLHFSHATPIPIQNAYKTPHTLGTDRLAGAVAAASLFPKQSTLVLQTGSCITSDFISEAGTYKGGNISPGLEMRLYALYHFSAKLPLVEYKNVNSFIGTSTKDSILTGVVRGIEDECNGIVERYINTFNPLKVILTGGDAKKFESKIRNKIRNRLFVIDNLVLIGLDVILNYNVEKEKNI